MHSYRRIKTYLLIFSMLFLALNSILTTLLTYIIFNVCLLILVITTCDKILRKIVAIVSYSLLLSVQMVYTLYIIDQKYNDHIDYIFVMIVAYMLLFFSISMENFLEIKNYNFYFTNNQKNVDIISFSDLHAFTEFLRKKKTLLYKSTDVLTKQNIAYIVDDIKRNSSFFYVNDGTLTTEYFKQLDKSLDNDYVYIVLSDTGSITSQMIELFTEKAFNHVSIAFDRELHTLISYNGGEKVNPPGLNSEMISFLAKKKDAAVYVYSLKVTKEQKLMMIDKIKEINDNGSAYNFAGMVFKRSFKPNIMYCSQFVYTLLEYAGANYFIKTGNNSIKPTDLVELDYYKKLSFEYEIRF